jgi:hypothetical protein
MATLDERIALTAADIALAAIELVKALDYTNPSWRAETLNVPDDEGDEVNFAWDRLVRAIEGKG